jgi:hypothetical protein
MRVVCISNVGKDSYELVGHGQITGRSKCSPDVFVFGRSMAGIENPEIKLDSGEVIWGCECWYDSEDVMKMLLGERTPVGISVQKLRERNK